MIIIGELINAARKSVKEALENRDKEFLQDLAKKQAEAGVDAIDVNVGISKQEEPSLMEWVIDLIQEITDKPLAIDTDNVEVLEAGLSVCKNQAWINSISGEKSRLNDFLPLIKKHDCYCIALAMNDKGILRSARQRFEVCKSIYQRLISEGVDLERVFFDPLVLPVGNDNTQGAVTLEILSLLKNSRKFRFQTIVAVSNISFGLPLRVFLNQIFLAMVLSKTDAMILNPLNREAMDTIIAGEMLSGKSLSGRYIKNYRKRLKEEGSNE